MTTVENKYERYRARKRAGVEQMPKIPCECGCGTMIAPVNKKMKPARFAHGHNPHGEATRFAAGQKAWNEGVPAPWSTERHKGAKRSGEVVANITAARRRYASSLPKVCGVDGCDRPVDRKGLCSLHYIRLRRKGEVGPRDPIVLKGPDKPTWKGGDSRYGFGFTAKFKALIRERDGNRCQECGALQADVRYTLHVHHKDFDGKNNDPTNLMTVCSPCHRRIHPGARKSA
ncbi:MAG: HNH endonuclease signature motif containing protein [Solirubrobacteraceae bacterium]